MVGYEAHPLVERVYLGIERSTGVRPARGCPWRAFRDSTVGEVLRAYRASQTGLGASLALLYPSDPPQYVIEGVAYYTSIVARIRRYEDEHEGGHHGDRARGP